MIKPHLAVPLTLILTFGPSTGAAQGPGKPTADSAHVVLARRLLQAMRYEESALSSIELALSEQRSQNPQLPAVFYDSVIVRIKRFVPDVVDSLAPSYARRFTRPELEVMIGFFESPTGQKFADQQAELSVEAMQFGQRWGARLAADVIKDLVDAGVDITKP